MGMGYVCRESLVAVCYPRSAQKKMEQVESARVRGWYMLPSKWDVDRGGLVPAPPCMCSIKRVRLHSVSARGRTHLTTVRICLFQERNAHAHIGHRQM